MWNIFLFRSGVHLYAIFFNVWFFEKFQKNIRLVENLKKHDSFQLVFAYTSVGNRLVCTVKISRYCIHGLAVWTRAPPSSALWRRAGSAWWETFRSEPGRGFRITCGEYSCFLVSPFDLWSLGKKYLKFPSSALSVSVLNMCWRKKLFWRDWLVRKRIRAKNTLERNFPSGRWSWGLRSRALWLRSLENDRVHSLLESGLHFFDLTYPSHSCTSVSNRANSRLSATIGTWQIFMRIIESGGCSRDIESSELRKYVSIILMANSESGGESKWQIIEGFSFP